MDPLTLALIMGGTGLAKGMTVDKAKEYKQAQLQAATTRYSPWTHLQGKEPERADPLGQGIAGAAYGMQLGQNNKAFEADQALKASQTAINNRSATLPFAGYGNGGQSNMFTNSDGTYNPNAQAPELSYGKKQSRWSFMGNGS